MVFLRTVMIYFVGPTRHRVIKHITPHIQAGGYPFIGHSKNLTDAKHSLTSVAPAIYRHPR